MSWLSLDRARTRIALSGARRRALFLGALALGARARIRQLAFEEIDDELDTLSVAIGSDYELVGLTEEERQALKAGLEANMFEFRLANHSAILFNGEVPVALTGNLLRSQERVSLANYLEKPEVPYTAIEPYSGQNRTCRFLVTHLQGKAKGATLVVFRWIGPTLRSLARVDNALGGMVLVGFLGTAAILAFAVHRAIRPVAGGHAPGRGGRGHGPFAPRQRLLGRRGVPAPGRRHQLALRPPRTRLPRAAAPGRRRRPRAEDPDRRSSWARRRTRCGPRPRRKSAAAPCRRSPTPPRASRARSTGCCCSPAGTRRPPRRTEELDLSDVAEEALAAVGGPRRAPQRPLRRHRAAATRACAASGRGCCGSSRTSSPTRSSTRTPAAMVEVSSRARDGRGLPRGRRPRPRHRPGRPRAHLRALRPAREDARAQSPGLGARPRDRRAGRRGPRRLGRSPRKRRRRRRLPRHAARGQVSQSVTFLSSS